MAVSAHGTQHGSSMPSRPWRWRICLASLTASGVRPASRASSARTRQSWARTRRGLGVHVELGLARLSLGGCHVAFFHGQHGPDDAPILLVRQFASRHLYLGQCVELLVGVGETTAPPVTGGTDEGERCQDQCVAVVFAYLPGSGESSSASSKRSAKSLERNAAGRSSPDATRLPASSTAEDKVLDRSRAPPQGPRCGSPLPGPLWRLGGPPSGSTGHGLPLWPAQPHGQEATQRRGVEAGPFW
jgi:hypothetical protein